MNNFEVYKDEISDVKFAVVDGKPTDCRSTLCADCLLHGLRPCDAVRWEWLKEEYVEPGVDWDTVEVDTPMLVSCNGTDWERRYFSRYENDAVYAWQRGATSWSACGDDDVVSWKYAKLAEDK